MFIKEVRKLIKYLIDHNSEIEWKDSAIDPTLYLIHKTCVINDLKINIYSYSYPYSSSKNGYVYYIHIFCNTGNYHIEYDNDEISEIYDLCMLNCDTDPKTNLNNVIKSITGITNGYKYFNIFGYEFRIRKLN